MHPSDDEFDPDDNFAASFDNGMDVDEDDSSEALVWQLLLLLNPGDEDAALQQFDAYRDALGESGEEEQDEPVWLLKDVIDWRAGFQVDDADRGSLIDAINELAARFNIDIDWGVEDPTDAQFLARSDASALIATAYDRLREHDYTLWTWNTARPGVEDETHAGWITQSRDDEAMQSVAAALRIELRRGHDGF